MICGAAHADATYDGYRRPDRVIAALGLAAGQRVADVGAGLGYLTFRLAAAVGPTGRVVATDIDAIALEALSALAPAFPNLVVRKATPDDPGLERAAYDLVLLAFVDQYLRDRADYLSRLRRALVKGGRLAVLNRQVFRDELVFAAGRAGFTVVAEVQGLPGQFLLLLAVRRGP
jgi:ubiquinone/menaquinone biosynthesis C-methylase UbiE